MLLPSSTFEWGVTLLAQGGVPSNHYFFAFPLFFFSGRL